MALRTTAHFTRELWRRKDYYIKGVFFPCLSETGSKRKLSFGLQLLSNSVCVRKTLSITQCPKLMAKVSISVAINPVGDRNNLKTTGFTIRTDPKPANNMFIFFLQ